MLETPKALGTIISLVKILKDVTMDNQQGTKRYLFVSNVRDPQGLHVKAEISV